MSTTLTNNSRFTLMRQRAFEASHVATSVDQTKKWYPDSYSHLTYLPFYQELLPEEKLKFNHLSALRFCENAILLEEWLEKELIIAMSKMKIDHLEIDEMIREEKEHSQLFRRLLFLSRPDLYKNNELIFSTQTFKLLSFIGRIPLFSRLWVVATLYFEETFIAINKHISRSPEIDDTHRKLHYAHCLDEISHVDKDVKLVELVWDTQASWKKNFISKIFLFSLTSSFLRVLEAKKVINYLKKEMPHLKTLEKRIFRELKEFISSSEYKQLLLSKTNSPKTLEMMGSRPEFAQLLSHFKSVESL